MAILSDFRVFGCKSCVLGSKKAKMSEISTILGIIELKLMIYGLGKILFAIEP